MKWLKKRRSAFTLLEMSIVLFIISLLILIILPNINEQRKNAMSVHQDAMVNVVQTQAELFENETGHQATSLSQLRANDYLTGAQLARAKHEQIVLHNGKAIRR
jgi:competence protein ComGC